MTAKKLQVHSIGFGKKQMKFAFFIINMQSSAGPALPGQTGLFA